jgi:HPt (histidine-containing phosphotransfer) domain-containing protein
MSLSRSAVDFSILGRTSSEMGADSAEQRRDLVQAYLEQGDGWIDQLDAAASTGDGEQAHRIAHALSSSSALIGALPLVERLQQISKLHTERAVLASAVAGARTEYQRVAAQLRSEYSPLGP